MNVKSKYVPWWSHDAKKLSSFVSASATVTWLMHTCCVATHLLFANIVDDNSIRHLLITCPCYVPIRSRYYRSNNLTHLQPSRIFSFLSEIKHYDKIWLFTFNLHFLCFYLPMYFACFHSSFCVTLFRMYFSFYRVLHSFFCLPASPLHVTLTKEFCFPKRLSLRRSRHHMV